MKFHTIKNTQNLAISLEEAWAFFSVPNNLKKITPPSMNLKITSEADDGNTMYTGQIITYALEPVWGIPVKWMTEITHVKHLHYFIDEQRFGPYKLWHHKHSFKSIDNGVQMIDEVNYVLPFGFLGTIVHKLFVRKKIESIFAHRTKVLENLFKK